MTLSSTSDLLVDLNPQQEAAVTSNSPYLLVLAGAGSGKTRVLVQRIAYLLQQQSAYPWQLLAVTFTNKAAREMRERLQAVGIAEADTVWMGTFHGIAHRILRRHAHVLGLEESFQILDADDQLRIIKRLFKDHQIDDEAISPRQVQHFINQQKEEGCRAAYVLAVTQEQKQYAEIYALYEQACRRKSLVDFAELLLAVHELLRDHSDILAHYQQRFRHILVDEFQDTNTLQYAWLRLLAGQDAKLTVVGDDDQSIYGWRGARIENIHAFSEDFRPCEVLRLEQNYRSSGHILAAANALIAHNPQRLGKQLWTQGAQGQAIQVYASLDEQDEATFIVNQIRKLRQAADFTYTQVGVLYRSNAQSRALEEALRRARLPYRIFGGQRFYERLEIKNALAYLRVLVHPQDDAALERIINVPARGIGSRTLERLRQYALQEGIALWDAAQALCTQGLFTGTTRAKVLAFLHLIEHLQAQIQPLALHEIIQEVLNTSGLLEHHALEKGEQGRTRVENLQELISAVRTYQPMQTEAIETGEDTQNAGRQVLASFLADAALDAGEHQAAEHQEAVQLMTLHAAKGLEFPYVFIAGVEENLFPHARSTHEPQELEEERRLMYVGITRAMRTLYLTYARSRRIFGREERHLPSRFLREIPSQHLQEINTFPEKRPAPAHQAPRKSSVQQTQVAHQALNLQLGQRVKHPLLGEGILMACEGYGERAKVQVRFAEGGDKWLILGMAKLEVL
ncbi:DNA helicase-2 / ATP-dependent DNA helicase PcrA [Allopseudospirillum japonicum]|uniref:DNA 3'-5' helicase n=1 Tax=Allopseudospirillum japonicum TaxID=64971 RepID=A0A1H6U6M5_9GAMM|nr:DNA helicase II [Allopseudospirillum japonicum]SEI87166.1 DNA helicase-2 / ATP-dependent DNA helicase PcrA [Allopseudospirillum japonicum]